MVLERYSFDFMFKAAVELCCINREIFLVRLINMNQDVPNIGSNTYSIF